MVFALSALLIGGLLAIQASVNVQLTRAVGTPYGASTLQLGVAAGVLVLATVAIGGLGGLTQLAHARPWQLLGGLASPIYITSGILLFPRLGALAAGGLFVTGQMISSLAIDLLGLFDIPRRPVSAGIAFGVVALLAGIVVIIRGQGGVVARGGIPWLLLGIVGGGVLPIQAAVNASLREIVGNPVTVDMISFLVAVLTIFVVLVALRLLGRTPAPKFAPLREMPWWGWLGGICASVYVMVTFLVVPAIGAAGTVALTVTGQQIASATVDGLGLFRMVRRKLTAPRLVGLGLLVLGSVLIQFG
ncbi:DMT family transporter [Kutzneria buriramensis]|uniref:Transporter family-2 protein n=1 Tax=Kutzneria buriramensis TaxID=1045776 RepID=A0A3E0HYV2_9PSEU|nr:DMT family transporter [Kutzneria buriramensis]REH51561.1 transporter family-2 protein [Kutzneria buriramensis]